MEYPVENVRNITVGNGIKRFRIFSGEDDWTKYNHVKYLIAAFNLTVLGYGEKSIDIAIRIAKTCRGEE